MNNFSPLVFWNGTFGGVQNPIYYPVLPATRKSSAYLKTAPEETKALAEVFVSTSGNEHEKPSTSLVGLPPVEWPPEMKSKIESWKEDHKTMFRWLMQRGYSPLYAQLLVASAFQLELKHPQLIGRVLRSPVQGTSVTWSGELPPRDYVDPTFSQKVFIGGVPWDIAESDLVNGFSKFGECRVEWPGRESRFPRPPVGSSRRPKAIGYVYLVFSRDDSVKKLLQNCTREWGSAGEWYFKLSSRRTYSATEVRQVQIIPWVISDACCIADSSAKLDPKRTVFVGALHGMMTSQVLCSIMNDVFGSVAYVGLDTDKYRYPIGSGRVTFSSKSSFFHAIEEGFLEIRTTKFVKKIQIDPYLEFANCSQCEAAAGSYFCRDKNCFKYFCLQCWQVRHNTDGLYYSHKPLVRKLKRSSYGSDEFGGGDCCHSLQAQMLNDWRNAHPLFRKCYSALPSFSRDVEQCLRDGDTTAWPGSPSGSISSSELSLQDLVMHCNSLPLSCSSPKKFNFTDGSSYQNSCESASDAMRYSSGGNTSVQGKNSFGSGSFCSPDGSANLCYTSSGSYGSSRY